MAITDIQISEELETGAPSIKYRGNEGPKSPQQKAEYDMQEYIIEFENVFPEMKELRGTQEYMDMLEDYFRGLAKGPVLPNDPTEPVNPFKPTPQGPVLPNRQMAAYGGIMGLDGRRQYGIGSSLKKRIRKLIPNEVAKVAEVAAPFVAPFNPLAAGLMKGVGGFDRTGSIGDSLKSGLMTYGLGQGARYLGGANFQGMPEFMGGQGIGPNYGFSMPTGSGGIKNLFKDKASMSESIPRISGNEVGGEQFTFGSGDALGGEMQTIGKTVADNVPSVAKENLSLMENIKKSGLTKGVLKNITEAGLDTKAMLGILGLSGAAGLYTAAQGVDKDMIKDMNRGEGLDIKGIRAEITEAMKDPSGKLLEALRVKYPFLGTQASKNTADMAMGGRIGRAEGGLMNLGGMEKDYRAEGGFVPIGREEKADDVPARLSVNEFVFTADAVRNAGGGDIDKGAEVMENMMKNLEAGGQVSEESQGIQGLRAGGRAGFANGLRVDTDKVIEDIKKFSIPNLIGEGVKAATDKISDTELESIIKVVAKAAPGGMVVEKVTEFLIDRYGMSPEEAQMRIVNKLGTDANEGFKQPSGTSDQGYRMVGIESSAEDTSDIPMRNKLRNLLGEVPSIEMPRPEKRFPEEDRYFPDGPGKFPERKPFRPGDGPDFELLKEMFDTSERLSEVVG